MKTNKLGFAINEYILEIVKVCVITVGVGYLFFDSVLGVVLAIPVGVTIFYQDIKDKKRRYINLVKEEFKEWIVATSGALGAGYSLEKALILAANDVKQIYPGGHILEAEIEKFKKYLELKITIEEIFSDFANRSGIEEIQNFAKVLIILKKNGGNTIKTIRETSENISTKIEVEKEIETMVAAKRLEHKIMCLMPFIIIGYMKMTNETYMNKLYHNISGAIVAVVALLVISAAFVIGNKIVDISVG